jgi:hypothetical protein
MSVYWVTFILFSSLGLGISGIFIKQILIEKIKFFITHPKNIKKRDIKKNTLIVEIFGTIFLLIIMVGIPAFCLYIVFPYWMDLPRAITGNYIVVQGNLNYSHETQNSGKSWGDNIFYKIDGIYYKSTKSTNASIGDKVEIEFLPHTNVILKIKKIE